MPLQLHYITVGEFLRINNHHSEAGLLNQNRGAALHPGERNYEFVGSLYP